MHDNPHLASAISVVLVFAAGCDGWNDYRRGERIKAAGAPMSATIAKMSLARGTQVSRPLRPRNEPGGRPQGAVRVVAASKGVDIDNAALLAGLHATHAPAVLGLDAGGIEEFIVARRGINAEQAPIVALERELARALAIEEELADHPQAAVELYFAKDTRLELVTAVMVTLALVELDRYDYAVISDDDPGFVEVAPPVGCGVKEGAAPKMTCAVTEIELSQDGAMVRALPLPGSEPACDKTLARMTGGVFVAKPTEDDPEWSGRPMLVKDDACPSVAKHAGAHDTHTLVALLRDVAAMSPGCDVAVVVAPGGTPWSEVAPVLTAVHYHTPFTRVAIASRRANRAGPVCTGGVRPSALEKVAIQKKKNRRKVDRLSIMGHLDDDVGDE